MGSFSNNHTHLIHSNRVNHHGFVWLRSSPWPWVLVTRQVWVFLRPSFDRRLPQIRGGLDGIGRGDFTKRHANLYHSKRFLSSYSYRLGQDRPGGQQRLAFDLQVPVTRTAEILHERRGITPDTALRLGCYFNASPRFWLNAQAAYDLEVTEEVGRK